MLGGWGLQQQRKCKINGSKWQWSMMPVKLWVCHAPRQECWSLLTGCMQTGVWVSGVGTQTKTPKPYVQYGVCQILSWTAGSWNASCERQKDSEGWTKVCPKPVGAEGGRVGAEMCVWPVGLVRFTLWSRWPNCWGYFTNKSIIWT